jgi:hypothetical protein
MKLILDLLAVTVALIAFIGNFILLQHPRVQALWDWLWLKLKPFILATIIGIVTFYGAQRLFEERPDVAALIAGWIACGLDWLTWIIVTGIWGSFKWLGNKGIDILVYGINVTKGPPPRLQ